MIPGQKQIVDGNKQVVQLLEHWLEQAKQGDIDYAAVIVCRGPFDSDRGHGGVSGREAMVCFAMRYLELQIMGDFSNRMSPRANAGVTADKWVYNLGRNPTTYDFIAWLVNAEMTRVRENAPFPLKVAFYAGQDGHLRDALHSDYQMQTFTNIVRPALAFVGAIESNEAQNGRVQECFSYVPAVEGYRRGEKVPMFKAPPDINIIWRDHVTITLREADRQPHRNSNIKEWMRFAHYLEDRGEHVIFVRDTAKAAVTDDMDGFGICTEASVNIRTRLKLYEQAKCNFFVSNGPASLAFFSECPWLMFSALDPKDSYFPNTPDGWRTFTGIGPGEQFPWSRPDQRIIWSADTFEAMRTAWEDLQTLKAAA